MKLLERDDLLATLVGLLDRARSGQGSLALVAGEAGAGKTSVVREVAARASSTAVVLEGACDPLSTPRPLSPLLDFAAHPAVQLAELLEGDHEAMDVFGAVLGRLKSGPAPVLMVLEDVHWADDATLDFIRYVGRRVGNTSGLVVCTYRDDELGSENPLTLVLGQLASIDTTHRLMVPALSLDAVAALAAGHALDPNELHRTTGGNAFYVTELIAAGRAVPGSVQDAVLARVGRLDAAPRAIVEAVSIAPRSLDIDHVVVLTGGSPDDVDAAVGSGVLVAERRSLRFRHELARAAVEASIPATRRLRFHRQMLPLLDEHSPDDVARLAHHAVCADAAELVVVHAPAAAEQSAKRGSRKEAVSFYEAALAHPELLDADRAAELRLDLVRQLGMVDRQEAALRQAALAVDHYRKTGQVGRLATALALRAGAEWNLTDTRAASATIDEAVGLLMAVGPSRDLAYMLYVAAHFSMLARRAGPALERAALALQTAEDVGAEDVAWMARSVAAGVDLVTGDAQRGAAALRSAIEAEPALTSLMLGNLGSGCGEARRYGDAVEALETAVAQGVAADEDYYVAYSRAWLARIAFEQGRWDDAVELAEMVERTSPSRIGIAIVTSRGALGRVRVRRGDPSATACLESALELGVRHELQHVWSPMCGLAEHAWLAAQPERIADILGDGYTRALDTDSPWARGEIGFWMWKAGAIDRPPDDAAEPFALQMAGAWREAAEAWREIGCPYEEALALLDGDEPGLLRAVAVFDTLGARPAGAIARARLREIGATSVPRGPSRRTAANPAGLTARQLEVLQLMAEGMSNGEIASALFVSKKTVEHHVSAVLSKLDVATRAKAIAAFESLRFEK